MKSFLQKILPRNFYRSLLAPYHAAWTFFSAVRYGFPAKKLIVIGVTGTKGKSSVSEMLGAILEGAGHRVAISSTIHFKIAEQIRPNLFKMTLPGRGFIQKFLRDVVDAKCEYAIVELTSEAAVQNRHLFLSLNALIFTNLEREHIESHGSMEKYFQAKFRLGTALAHSPKRPRAIIANSSSEYGKRFLALPVEESIPFSLGDASDVAFPSDGNGVSFIYKGVNISLLQPGNFSVLNALAAMKTCEFFGVSVETSAHALATLARIPGRAERIEAGQDFIAIVDYGHTPDSLRALYDAYKDKRKICVLGNTGGGRDTWKRPEMGSIADEACDMVFLTDEDPYDENPKQIVDQMASGMKREPTIIMDRRKAIRAALRAARPHDVVLITGKGTDPYIMQANGKKLKWSDAQVVREELESLKS